MGMGIRSFLPAALAAAALLAGCGGGDGGGGGDAVELTKWLPPGALAYRVADIAAFKDEAGLPEGADPMRARSSGYLSTGDAFVLLLASEAPEDTSYETGEKPPRFKPAAVQDAFDLTAITAIASSYSDDDEHKGTDVTVLTTTQDAGEIGSALGDGGYVDRDGILEPPDSGPAVRILEDVIYLAVDPKDLRGMSDEPAEDLPLRILGEVEGTEVGAAVPPRPARGSDCIEEYALAGGGEEGEIAYLVDGEADPARFETSDDPHVEDVETDGDLLIAHVALDEQFENIVAFQAEAFPRYDCP